MGAYFSSKSLLYIHKWAPKLFPKLWFFRPCTKNFLDFSFPMYRNLFNAVSRGQNFFVQATYYIYMSDPRNFSTTLMFCPELWNFFIFASAMFIHFSKYEGSKQRRTIFSSKIIAIYTEIIHETFSTNLIFSACHLKNCPFFDFAIFRQKWPQIEI